MKTIHVIHVQTKRVSSYKENGEPKYEVLTQKLEDLTPFKTFLNLIPTNKYIDVKVVGLFDQNKKEVLTDEAVLAPYQERVKKAIESSNKTQKTPKDIESLKKENQALEERLKALEEKLLGGSDSDAEYKKELQEEIKELGGKVQGLKTIQSLEARLEELRG